MSRVEDDSVAEGCPARHGGGFRTALPSEGEGGTQGPGEVPVDIAPANFSLMLLLIILVADPGPGE
ncbi:hypothetical protein GCM10010253_18340 [Streptomyces badius]|uniref:Uncharacterized protein n=1 Tax=Streptomyces badius TaxID=1941 RepID=A0ABQ2SYF9_STRBA|nr:hypothetical protein GCM10010253_18340 [Streptomyces badius]